jgi:hypothetical protein
METLKHITALPILNVAILCDCTAKTIRLVFAKKDFTAHPAKHVLRIFTAGLARFIAASL